MNDKLRYVIKVFLTVRYKLDVYEMFSHFSQLHIKWYLRPI